MPDKLETVDLITSRQAALTAKGTDAAVINTNAGTEIVVDETIVPNPEEEKLTKRAEEIFNRVAIELPQRRHFPTSTYRLQLNKDFTFNDTRELIPYLKELGIGDMYASPYLKARADSMHGYDICDHNSLNPEIGTMDEFNKLVATIHEAGMGHILDTVPNHMGIGDTNNTWWMDVLENGPSSIYATYFDIDWAPPKAELQNKVLLPILGDQYGRVLENGEIQLTFQPQDGAFSLHYWETTLPVNVSTYNDVLELGHAELLRNLGSETTEAIEYQSILTALSHLPHSNEVDWPKIIERNREKEVIKRRLATLCATSPAVLAHIEANITLINGVKGEPESFNKLDTLMAAQGYRLSFWRVAAEEINYRRFFDVNHLAAIRVENPPVFYDTHRLILRLISEGKLNGLRIDHPDGLWDPASYFWNLQKAYFLEMCRKQLEGEEADVEWEKLQPLLVEKYTALRSQNPQSPLCKSLYVVVEKILARGERIPDDWQVEGTSGYDFLNNVNFLFVATANQKVFDRVYNDFTGEKMKFTELIYQTRQQIMRVSLSSEINVLTNNLNKIAERNRYYRDYTFPLLRHVIREVMASFPVYRTYINDVQETPLKRDQNYIETAVARAKLRNPTTDASAFDFLKDILLLKFPVGQEEEDRQAQLNFVLKFQQCTGPVMAKGLEDTAFYIYNRLISLNEVGGEPEQFGQTLSAFHRQNSERLRQWPHALLTTSTHDTKRSEDVRARIDVLSEIPKEWRAALNRWHRLNRRKCQVIDGMTVPGRNEEYFLYQTLLGAWPTDQKIDDTFVERIASYMLKVAKEAKVHTSWFNADSRYETALQQFVRAILDTKIHNAFLVDFTAFQRKIAHFGAFNSLAQTLLKATSPGVPDIYQGTEIWDLSLVDPDNRRPVDYRLRRRFLKEINEQAAQDKMNLVSDLLEHKEDGRIKLYVLNCALNYRRENPLLFMEGSYTPLVTNGEHQDHICAFARIKGDQIVLVAIPRLLTGLTKGDPLGIQTWGDTTISLPGGLATSLRYENLYTGEIVEPQIRDQEATIPVALLFARFPVALLRGMPRETR